MLNQFCPWGGSKSREMKETKRKMKKKEYASIPIKREERRRRMHFRRHLRWQFEMDLGDKKKKKKKKKKNTVISWSNFRWFRSLFMPTSASRFFISFWCFWCLAAVLRYIVQQDNNKTVEEEKESIQKQKHKIRKKVNVKKYCGIKRFIINNFKNLC